MGALSNFFGKIFGGPLEWLLEHVLKFFWNKVMLFWREYQETKERERKLREAIDEMQKPVEKTPEQQEQDAANVIDASRGPRG